MSDEDPEQKKSDESLQEKIDDFNLFLEELESDWIDEEEKPVEEEIEVKKPKVKPKSKIVKEKKAIPKPRPIDPSTQEIHVDLETGEVTFDDLDELIEAESEEIGKEVLDELIDADVSETIEIDEIEDHVATKKASEESIDIHDDTGELEEEEEEEEDEVIFFGRVERPKNPEQFAHNYLFARFPVNFMLILIPQTIGLLVSIFVNKSFVVDSLEEDISGEKKLGYQDEVIDNYLFAVKLTLVILLAFFLCYRWSTMQNDGSYGYWLTQGVNRRKFFIETIYKFLAVIYFGIFAGLMSLFYLNGIYLEFTSFIMLNLLILSHVLLLISVGIVIGVFTKNPESAALFFIIGFGINYAFNTSSSSLLNKVLQSDLQYKAEIGDVWLSLVTSVTLGAILVLASLRVHMKLDMEL